MLSEKAKGKQRAVEPFDDQNDGQNPNIRVGDVPQDILVRFTDGAPDVTVVVAKGSSVQDVKQLVRLFAFPFTMSSASRISDKTSPTRTRTPSSEAHPLRETPHKFNLSRMVHFS